MIQPERSFSGNNMQGYAKMDALGEFAASESAIRISEKLFVGGS